MPLRQQGAPVTALADFNITTVGAGDVLKHNGTVWVNSTLSDAGIAPVNNATFTGTTAVHALSLTNNAIKIGLEAGLTDHGPMTTAVGGGSGRVNQQSQATAVGFLAGTNTQGPRSVAVGVGAGRHSQGADSVAVGSDCAQGTQGTSCIAVGAGAGRSSQQAGAISIGRWAGSSGQQSEAVAVGFQAGNQGQGAASISIGAHAGFIAQHSNSIVLNATGSQLNTTRVQALYVKPIQPGAGSHFLKYDPVSGEITYN